MDDYDTLISIAEEFNEWLEDISKKYNIDKDDVQEVIKSLLCGYVI